MELKSQMQSLCVSMHTPIKLFVVPAPPEEPGLAVPRVHEIYPLANKIFHNFLHIFSFKNKTV